MGDPRFNYTSASNAEADGLCPGRHLAQRGIPAPPESKDARAGTIMHAALAGEDCNELMNPMQRKTLKRALELEAEIVTSMGFDQKAAHREQRLWAKVKGDPIHSGQIDAFWIAPDWKRAMIEDLKGLFGDVTEATENPQLRDYAALLWENFGIEEVAVWVNQPNVVWNTEEQVIVKYELKELKRAHKEMLARVARSNTITAKRVPGLKQCAFCRAAGTGRCPESQEAMLEPCKTPRFDVDTASAKQRGEWIELLKTSAKAIEKMLGEAKSAVGADSAWAEGWGIGRGRETRSISDTGKVFVVLTELLDNEQAAGEAIMAASKISVPTLEAVVSTATGIEGKPAKEQFKMLFGHLIETKESEGSLVRVKE